jgi:choline-sulfatase
MKPVGAFIDPMDIGATGNRVAPQGLFGKSFMAIFRRSKWSTSSKGASGREKPHRKLYAAIGYVNSRFLGPLFEKGVETRRQGVEVWKMRVEIWSVAFLSLAALANGPTVNGAERPNVVFIYCDDLAPWALGVAGHPNAKTPHLDKLFRDGAYLVNSFTVTPVCSPSRGALVTSRYGSELGITDWIQPERQPDLGLDPRLVIWPQVFSRGGYRTALIGKWHLGTRDAFHPTVFGYQHFMGFRAGGNTPMNPTLEVAGKNKPFTGCLADIVTDEAIAVVGRDDPRPFLISLHFREPHRPYVPTTEEDWALFRDLDPTIPNPDYPNLDVAAVKKATREYLASVHSIDRNVGRLLAELDRRKLAEKTVVIFSSDHGYNIGHNGIWHKGNGHWMLTESPPGTANIPKGQRPNMYDNSLRVPAAIRWPGVIRPGTIVKETLSNLDWYPTLVAIAGLELPPGTIIRGKNFLPLVKGDKLDWNNDFYAEYSTFHQSKTHMRAWRTPEWKLVRDFLNPGRDELYHLKEDPAEQRNLIDSDNPAARVAQSTLHGKILARMQELGDRVLAEVTSGAN